MKKQLLFLFIASVITGVANAQLQYNQFYFRMTPQDGVNAVVKTDGSSLVAAKNYTGAVGEQWAIMPMSIIRKNGILETDMAKEFIIATRNGGKTLFLPLTPGSTPTGHVGCTSPFSGKSNHVFKLNPTGVGSIYHISSPLAVNSVVQVYVPQLMPVIVFASISSPPSGKQKFNITQSYTVPYSFSSLTNKRTLAIPFPAAPTSFTQLMPTETPKTFIEEMLIPYPLIKNDLAYSLQVENSLFYKLVHRQYYRRAAGNWDVVYPKNGTYTHSVQVKVGTLMSQVNEVTTKLDISFSQTGEVNWMGTGIGAKLSNTIAGAFGKTVRQVTTWQETYERTENYSSTVNTLALDRRVVTYQLVDHYELYRANNQTTPTLTWEVGRDESTQVFFEGEASGGGRLAASELEPISYKLVNGKMVPISSYQESLNPEVNNHYQPEEKIRPSVYPNPSKDIYSIQVKPALYKDFQITVYDQDGKIVYQDQRQNAYIERITDLSLSSLPTGKYFMKVKTDNETWVERIVRD